MSKLHSNQSGTRVKSCIKCEFEINIESDMNWFYCPECGYKLENKPLVEAFD